jgi:hypothetical protein
MEAQGSRHRVDALAWMGSPAQGMGTAQAVDRDWDRAWAWARAVAKELFLSLVTEQARWHLLTAIAQTLGQPLSDCFDLHVYVGFLGGL